MTPEEKYRDLYEQMYDLCEEQGWGDPFSYARSREIYMAGLLGHKVADDYSGEMQLMKMVVVNTNLP